MAVNGPSLRVKPEDKVYLRCTYYCLMLQNGVGGMRCSDCDDGFFAFSSAGCLLCNCSGRTSNCQLDPTSPISDPQELCQCPFPYDGNTCEHCLDGYYLSSQTGNCELCQCNGRADSCQDGTGECIVSCIISFYCCYYPSFTPNRIVLITLLVPTVGNV